MTVKTNNMIMHRYVSIATLTIQYMTSWHEHSKQQSYKRYTHRSKMNITAVTTAIYIVFSIFLYIPSYQTMYNPNLTLIIFLQDVSVRWDILVMLPNVFEVLHDIATWIYIENAGQQQATTQQQMGRDIHTCFMVCMSVCFVNECTFYVTWSNANCWSFAA